MATRPEVNMLKYSFLMPYFEYMNNYSAEYYWGQEIRFHAGEDMGDVLLRTRKCHTNVNVATENF